jgi:hypothetical protein
MISSLALIFGPKNTFVKRNVNSLAAGVSMCAATPLQTTNLIR